MESEEINMTDLMTDGKFYELGDMVKANCADCVGCSKCCQSMGDSIVLNPLDVFRLTKGTGLRFEELLQGKIALHVEEGVITPHIKMTESEEKCPFLGETGRCEIHAFRPGICRLFPLGRNYEQGKLNYILLTGECEKKNRSKIKVEKWLSEENLKENQRFLIAWHYLIRLMKITMSDLLLHSETETTNKTVTTNKTETANETEAANVTEAANKTAKVTEETMKQMNLFVLALFYQTPWQMDEDFYPQFFKRLEKCLKDLNLEAEYEAQFK